MCNYHNYQHEILHPKRLPLINGKNEISQKKLIFNKITKRSIESLGKTQGRLVILGSGWAGFKLLRDLRKEHYEVIVISPSTPLLASSSVGTLEFRCIMEPIRKHSSNLQYYQAYADNIDLKNQVIHCTSNLELSKNKFSIPYDTLVIAVGANSNTFGIKGVGDYALFLKDVSDARKIRQRVIECFEHASQPLISEEEIIGLLHFAVVGGGPTGVEFSAELYDFITEDISRLYPRLMNKVTMTVYDVAPQILGSFDVSLRDYATKKFARKGLTDNPFTRSMSDQVLKDKSARRLLTDEFLRVLSKENGQPIDNVYALALNQIAEDKGSMVRTSPFVFRNLGSMAYIGKKEAVVDLTPMSERAKEGGTIAWLFWRSSYFTMTKFYEKLDKDDNQALEDLHNEEIKY
ncbi:835_t:CDS:10 [Diversispora eburnea]|uniref:NADH:ubiquinone reductase (non-electrogenic) n=1 Tax=Diversispora eburnea TaxID=1213867 RepID=A0A9N9EZB1_9GLOM|nr:835_t:CDS:10 [Diversispora eburnea]